MGDENQGESLGDHALGIASYYRLAVVRARAQVQALEERADVMGNEKKQLRQEILLLQNAWRESEDAREIEQQRALKQEQALTDALRDLEAAQNEIAKATRATSE